MNFSDTTLILVGHGSTKNPQSKAPVYQHAAQLRGRKIFSEVREAFWKEAPFIHDVLGSVSTATVVIVPIFISEGYFTLQAIPRELGLVDADKQLSPEETPLRRTIKGRVWIYCRPIGTHESMTEVLLSRAKKITEQFPFPHLPRSASTTLFIAGHGTYQNENSRAAIERQVELVRAKAIYANVFPLFIEEEPRIGACYQLAQTKNVVIVPFFVSDGMHTIEDIPVMLGEPERIVKERLRLGQPTWRNPTEKKEKRVWYAPSIGSEPGIAEIILQRVREASA